jgi:uncharacterized membrane protein
VIAIARPSVIALHCARTVLVASLIPTALFYICLSLSGLHTAVLAALGWYYAVLVVRAVRRRPIVGAAMLGAGLLTARAVLVFWTGSAYLYFLQPVAGTVATAASFGLTAIAGRPLLERLAHDFVPLPPDLSERLREARFFAYTSVLWTVAYGLNAAATVWLLTNSSLDAFLLIKPLLGPVLTGTTSALSFLLFRRWMRRDGIDLRWAIATA